MSMYVVAVRDSLAGSPHVEDFGRAFPSTHDTGLLRAWTDPSTVGACVVVRGIGPEGVVAAVKESNLALEGLVELIPADETGEPESRLDQQLPDELPASALALMFEELVGEGHAGAYAPKRKVWCDACQRAHDEPAH